MAWITVILLWPVAALNYMDRQMLAAMKSSVVKSIPDFSVDTGNQGAGIDQSATPSENHQKEKASKEKERWGLVLAVFKWTYACLSPLGGWLADRLSRRWTIGLSLLVWSIVTWYTGHVTSYNELLMARALMGISEAFYMPAALAMIANYHPVATRSRAVGIHQTAMYFGVIVGGFSGYVAESSDEGWRWAFDLAGYAGIAYALPLLFCLRDAKPSASNGANPNSNTGWNGIRKELLLNRSFFILVVCFTLPALAGWVVKDWMPAIMKERFNIGQGMAGVSATLFVNIASLFSVFLGGWLADRWMNSSTHGRIYVSAIGTTILIPSLVGVGNASTLSIAIVFLFLYGIGWGFFDCNNMPILSQIVRPELRATGYGIMNFVSISCGGLADWQFGALQDKNVSIATIFGAFAIIALVSTSLILLIKPRTQEELQS